MQCDCDTIGAHRSARRDPTCTDTMTDRQATHTVSPSELAEAIGRSPSTVRRWIREGYIKAMQLGSEYRITKADANAWCKSRGGGLLYPDAGIGEVPDEGEDADVSLDGNTDAAEGEPGDEGGDDADN